MSRRFFDTSAFAKHYHRERGTARIDAIRGEAGSEHFISALGVVELHSVLARLVRERKITAGELDLAHRRFLGDIASGLWKVLPVTPVHFHHAQDLLVRYGPRRSLRTLDAIQLAVSLENDGHPFDAFVCADGNLCQIAAAEGHTAVNPEEF